MNLIKGILRAIARLIIETIHRLLFNIPDMLFGFLKWPGKKIRIKIFILKIDEQDLSISPADLETSLKFATKIFREKFNVDLLPVDRSFVEVLSQIAPEGVLYTKGGRGGLIEEFKTAGNFFAANLVSPIYPITVFVVKDIEGATGCSLGPLTDYVTLDHDGAKDKSVLAHELAHACGLWHVKDKTNLLWHTRSRGDDVAGWQKNIFRSSRHITYW